MDIIACVHATAALIPGQTNLVSELFLCAVVACVHCCEALLVCTHVRAMLCHLTSLLSCDYDIIQEHNVFCD